MVHVICSRVQCTQGTPFIKVFSANSLSLEARGTDSSLKLTLQSNSYPMMYYLLRFFKMNSSHKVEGALNVSAYTSDSGSKAYTSIRVSATSISPIREIDDKGMLLGATMHPDLLSVTEIMSQSTREYKKIKFLIFKYVWDFWDNAAFVKPPADNLKEPFSEALEDMYDNLVELNLIPTNLCPVIVVEKEVRRLKKNGASTSRRKVSVRIANPNVAISDFSSPLLNFKDLMDDTVPFVANYFIKPSTTASNNNGTSQNPPTDPNNSQQNGESMQQ